MNDSDIEKVPRRGGYCEQVCGMSQTEQVRYLKPVIGRVLLEENSYTSTDHQNRLEVLMEMLRRRSMEFIGAAHRFFYGEPKAPKKSPNRPGAGVPGGRAAAGLMAKAPSTPPPMLTKSLELEPWETARDSTRHSTIKVMPSFKWPTLGDDGPDSNDIEELRQI